MLAAGSCFAVGDFVAEAFDALAVGVFGLDVAKFGFVAHADVPFAEGEADFGLIEGFYA